MGCVLFFNPFKPAGYNAVIAPNRNNLLIRSNQVSVTGWHVSLKKLIPLIAKSIAAFALLFVLSHRGFAQRMDITGGSIGVSYTASPSQSFKDTSGSFGYHSFAANISIPLFGNRHKMIDNILQGDKPHFYEISGHAAFDALHSTIGIIETPRNIYQASAGLNGLFYNGHKNIILADLSMGIASDGQTIQNNDTKYRFSGAFIVNHMQNASLTWQYGVVFNYAYGRPLPLPVLGIRKKFAKTWSFSAILPVSVQFTDRFTKSMNISFLLRPAGNRFQLQNQSDFNTSSPTVYMQLRQFELGLSYLYRFTQQFSFGAEAGLLAGGKLKFTEVDDIKTTLYQTGMKPGARFRFSLRYRLPHKKTTGNNVDMDGELFRVN
jgi:hypothetical protein